MPLVPEMTLSAIAFVEANTNVATKKYFFICKLSPKFRYSNPLAMLFSLSYFYCRSNILADNNSVFVKDHTSSGCVKAALRDYL